MPRFDSVCAGQAGHDGLGDRGRVCSVEGESAAYVHSWLGHHPGCRATVWPGGGVDDERVAEIHVAGSAGGVRGAPAEDRRPPLALDFLAGDASFSIRRENSRDVLVRTGHQPGRRVVVSHVGEKEQRKQTPPWPWTVRSPGNRRDCPSCPRCGSRRCRGPPTGTGPAPSRRPLFPRVHRPGPINSSYAADNAGDAAAAANGSASGQSTLTHERVQVVWSSS